MFEDHLNQFLNQKKQLESEVEDLQLQIKNNQYNQAKIQGVIEYIEQLIEYQNAKNEPDFVEVGTELPES